MSDTGLSLSQQDANKLELSYKTLASLQRKTLGFLNALVEYEKNRRQSGNNTPSRIAFIVTPLMVNHYNHMHTVYRASLYNKVPDLCEQTGGIACADLNALREELATATADTDGPVTNAFRAATLPNVQFNFKRARDTVFETAVRMLDSIDIKHPDLTNSVRDDYIQNVRAIQESLTNALEKSKDRSAELQSRLDDALRKLKLVENTMAYTPNESHALQTAVTKLKEKLEEQEGVILRYKLEDEARALDTKRDEAKSKLLQEITERMNQRSQSEANDMVTLRNELVTHVESELKTLKDGFQTMHNSLKEHVSNVLSRSHQEKQETITACESLLNQQTRDDDTLKRECDQLKEQNVKLMSEINELRSRFAATNDFEMSGCENDNTNSRTADVESLVQQYEQKLSEFQQTDRQQKTSIVLILGDLASICKYFTIKENAETAVDLARYFYDNNIEFYSEQGANLLKFLETIVTSEDVRSYVERQRQNRISTVIHESGLMQELNQNKMDIGHLENTIGYSVSIMRNLLTTIDDAYASVADVLGLNRLMITATSPEELINHFSQRFGADFKSAVDRLATKCETLEGRVEHFETEKAKWDLQSHELLTKRQELEQQAAIGTTSDFYINRFDGDPILFEDVLQKVWSRSDTDRLKGLLNSAYYALAIDRVNRYETTTADVELKLYNVIEYTVLTDYIQHTARENEERPELINPKLNEDGYFLQHFINQLGNVQIENYINTLDTRTRNKLAVILFNDYYIPVVNKRAFIMSIEGPFANFKMVYKV